MEQGLILLLQFNAFDIEQPDFEFDYDTYEYDFDSPTCRNDHLTITDGDGTTLMEKSCGGSSFDYHYEYDYGVAIGGESIGFSLPPAIRSRTNTINLVFITDGVDTSSGWSVSWRAVAGINHQPS